LGILFSRVHAPLQPALSVGWSVGWLVGRSVTFYFFLRFYSLTSQLLPKWSSDLKCGPCPPARDFGSRVSGLVKSGSHSSLTRRKVNSPYWFSPLIGPAFVWVTAWVFRVAPLLPSSTRTTISLVRGLLFPDRRKDQLRQFASFFLRLPRTDSRQDNDCREKHQLNLHTRFMTGTKSQRTS